MKHTTTWKPDTCECELHYEWDDAVPTEERIHTPVEQVTTHDGTIVQTTRCRHHEHLTGHVSDVHAAVSSENQNKNRLYALVVETHPELTTKDAAGNAILHPGSFEWLFDERRALVVKVKGINTDQSLALQNEAREKLGINDPLSINAS